jgi:acyl-CoA synthetase (AMP-forming)/AMP-acid ligase II
MRHMPVGTRRPRRHRRPTIVRRVRLPLANRIETAVVLAQRGLMRPVRPDRLVRMGLAFHHWGVSVAAAFAVNAIAREDQVALVDDHGSLTYGEVDRRTNALANELARLGVGEHDRVGILCRNGSTFVEAMVAAAKLGADVLPLNTSFAAGELKAVIAREKPPVLVHDASLADMIREARLGSSVHRIVAHSERKPRSGSTYEELIAQGRSEPPSSPSEEGRTVILTSGTTGTPKGARLARPGGLEPLAQLLKAVPIHAGSAYLIPAPLFHAHGYGQLVLAGSLGCTVVLPRRFDAEVTLALIEKHRIESLAAVPVMLKRILDLPAETRRRYDTSSLRAVVCSGSSLDPRLARSFMDEFGPVIYNLYGSTEMAWATIATPKDLLEAPGTVGRPPPHTRVQVLGEDGRPLPVGETGRIFVGHEMLFEGYTDGRAGRERIEGMLTAGDLGHVDAEGRLFVDAREDDMIIAGGENVFPSEIEEVLCNHPDIAEVAVVGAEDPDFGQRPVAFVVPNAGSSLEAGDVDRFAREKLARFKVPRDVVVMEELPRNALGKVLRRELRPPAHDGRRKVG